VAVAVHDPLRLAAQHLQRVVDRKRHLGRACRRQPLRLAQHPQGSRRKGAASTPSSASWHARSARPAAAASPDGTVSIHGHSVTVSPHASYGRPSGATTGAPASDRAADS
jgi:hypothetical protein